MRYGKIFILLLWPLLIMGCATEINKVKLYEAPEPDERVLKVVSKVMQEYINKLDWKEGCVLEVDTSGIVETNWHPVNQGDMKRKIQIYVWGAIYRVDVWHQTMLGPFKGNKDYMSRLVEMNLQFAIEKKLTQMKTDTSLNFSPALTMNPSPASTSGSIHGRWPSKESYPLQ